MLSTEGVDELARFEATVIETPVAKLWRLAVEGDIWPLLEHLLDAGQVSWLRDFHVTADDWGWLIGRQRGKSDAALTYAVVRGVNRKQRFKTKYCALTKDTAEEISAPILDRILADCPDWCAPRLPPGVDPKTKRPQKRVLKFPTNPKSELKIFGTDAQSFRKGRGGNCDLLLFDEFGFYQEPEKVESALAPSLQTTNGRTLYLSTPSEEPNHVWAQRCSSFRARGRLRHDTWLSNPRINHQEITRREADKRGMTVEEFTASTYYQREYLAREVTEAARAALPAWSAMLNADDSHPLVHEFERPKHFDAYVSVDWGGVSNDPHAATFGFFDFVSQTLFFEEESEMRGLTMAEWVVELKAIETRLWGVNSWDGTLLGAREYHEKVRQLPDFLQKSISEKAPRQPYLRVCDHDEQLQLELMKHGYALLPVDKYSGGKHIMADDANNWVKTRRIVVHPRCRRLIEQLRTGVWNPKRTEWVRTDKDHFDLGDDVIYTVRSVRVHRDPRPPVVDAWTLEQKRTEDATQLLKLKPPRHSRWR